MNNTPHLKPLPAGIGLRSPHIDPLLDNSTDVGFLEIHAENFFGAGIHKTKLLQLAETYPISVHGVGLSLGRHDALDQQHLTQLTTLVNELKPTLVSEHIAWNATGDVHAPDLLPVPYNNEALEACTRNIHSVQNKLGRQILIENPSLYMATERFFPDNTLLRETDFIQELAHRTQCGLLLDINNIVVSANNVQFCANDYLNALDPHAPIQEFHLAGHQQSTNNLLIDTHGDKVQPAVWALYQRAIERFGYHSTLIEWDTDIPDINTLIREASTANQVTAQAFQQRTGS